MVLSQVLLFPLLVVVWSVLGGVSSYGVPLNAFPEGFHQPITSVQGPSVTKTTSRLFNAVSPSSSEKRVEDEPSDYEIMSAISSSMADWRERRERMKSHVHRRAVEEVCYELFGCFNNTGHFAHLELPQEPDLIGTRFMLYTRDQPDGSELTCFANVTTERQCTLNTNKPIKVIIHGFSNTGGCAWVRTLTDALLDVDDFNVIVVDWAKGACLPNYVQAVSNSQLVGRQLARFLEQLHVQAQVDYNNVHLIGFSLGAQVAGFAGTEVRGLGRITGLDPASPLFEGYHVDTRLDPTDAKFVDIIHTNGNSFPWGGLGILEPLGHVDFYPNGGKHQPGCTTVIIGIVKYYFTGSWDALCNHRRAISFFIDSLKSNCSFTSFPCDSFEDFSRGNCFHCPPSGCPNMGFYADTTKVPHGKYYLVNTEVEPFCEYQKKIEVSSSHGKGYTWGYLDLVFHAQGRVNKTVKVGDYSQKINEDEQIQQIVITQPEFQSASEVSVLYSKYDGWIWKGKDNWYLDKISISDTSGNRYSYCGVETEFQDGKIRKLPLTAGSCTTQAI